MIRPFETTNIHLDHLNWLQDRLSLPHPSPTIVITHHCPHPDLISAIPSDLDPVYGSNLTGLIARYQPDVWFFGHTHHHAEAWIASTLVRNVSLGYPDQVCSGTERQTLLRGLVKLDDQGRPEIDSIF